MRRADVSSLQLWDLETQDFFEKNRGPKKNLNHIIHHMPDRVCVSGARKKIFFSIQFWAQF